MGRELPVTIALKSIIEKMFPEEYEQRRLEARGIIGGMEGDEAPLPLFVMACMMPGKQSSRVWKRVIEFATGIFDRVSSGDFCGLHNGMHTVGYVEV